MATHEFTIVASGLDPRADDFEDRFFEGGCSDATISFQRGVIVLRFDREADSFAKAVSSAMRDVQKIGVRLERVEPDYLVSLADIAERTGLSRSAITLYARGERGDDFPSPVARVTSSSPLWDWSQVAEWLRKRDTVDADGVAKARIVKEANATVQEIKKSIENLESRLKNAGEFRGEFESA